MKHKVFIIHPIVCYNNSIEKMREHVPDLFVSQNGEEVLAMVRDKEVERVCVVLGTVGFSECEITKAIHVIDPSIPVLVYGSFQEKISPNEYLTDDAGFFFESVNEFLNDEFTEDFKFFPKINKFWD
jgi:DNA-binding NarL/FixJ family response regulator